MNKTICRTCNAAINALMNATGEECPEWGDFNVCSYCGTISRFDQDLNLREATRAEIDELRAESAEAWEYLHNIAVTVTDSILEQKFRISKN